MLIPVSPLRLRPWTLVALLVFFLSSAIAPVVLSDDESPGTAPSELLPNPSGLVIASHPVKLQLPPGKLVEGSPGSKPGAVMECSRVLLRGVSRLRHLGRFFDSLKMKLEVIQADRSFRITTVEVCLHRNASVVVGMCPPSGWRKISKGSWVQSVSPFGNKILDLRMMPGQSSTIIEISTEEELLLHRVFFLVAGFLLMALARVLSESVVFYYGSAMTIGIVLVILMVLFQGMKLLPTGRKSSLAIFMYSSIVGVGTFILHYLSGLLRSALVEMGIGEDIHKPLAIFFLLCLFLAGAWLGFWGVRKLILDEDGIVDRSVAYFVEWSIRIFAAAMILQSSSDPVLATEALLFSILIKSVMRSTNKSRFLRRLYRRITKFIRRSQMNSSPSKYSPISKCWTPEPESASRRLLFPVTPRGKNTTASTEKFPRAPATGQTYYSSFHVTPERRKYSREEWEAFTRDSTNRAMEELSSSPDFARWVATNANRITVAPDGDDSRTGRKLRWF